MYKWSMWQMLHCLFSFISGQTPIGLECVDMAKRLTAPMHMVWLKAIHIHTSGLGLESSGSNLLSEVCHSIGMEPHLQPVTGKHLTCMSANKEDGARLDVVAESFQGRDWQCAFFDVRVFNPFVHSYHNSSLAQCYRRNEMDNRR